MKGLKKLLSMAMVFAMLAALLVPAAVFAVTDGTDVAGTISAEFTLQAPGDVVLPALVTGTHLGDSSGSIYATATGWTLTVADASTNKKAGYLVGATDTTGTADSGSTTTLVDAALTQVDDYWNGAVIAIAGEETVYRAITDWVLSTNTLTIASGTEITTQTYSIWMPLGAALGLNTTAGSYTTISSYSTALASVSNYGLTGAYTIPLYVEQVRAEADDIADVYSITLTYTGTAG